MSTSKRNESSDAKPKKSRYAAAQRRFAGALDGDVDFDFAALDTDADGCLDRDEWLAQMELFYGSVGRRRFPRAQRCEFNRLLGDSAVEYCAIE